MVIKEEGFGECLVSFGRLGTSSDMSASWIPVQKYYTYVGVFQEAATHWTTSGITYAAQLGATRMLFMISWNLSG